MHWSPQEALYSMTPQRLGRKLLLVLLGMVGCVLLVVLMLPYIVSLDSVRDQLVGQIEAALHRKVDVGAVRLQLLSGLGVGLEDLTIYNPPGWQQPYVMKAATLSIKVAWRPFLQRRIEITKMILRDGEIIIERDPQGRLNIADVAVAEPTSAQPLPADIHRSPSGPGARAAITPLAGLRLSDVTLQKVPITFVDRMVVPGQAIITAVSDFQLHLRDVALGTPIPIDMSATMLTEGSQNIRLRGSVGPIPESLAVDSVPIDVHLQTTALRLDKLTPYLGSTFPLAQGRFAGEVRLQGSIASSLRLSGSLSLADAVLREGIVSDAATALPTLTSTQDVTVDLPTGRAELTGVAINLADIQASIKGVVHAFTTSPQLDLQVATNTFPAALLTHLPPLASRLPTPTEVRGSVQLQATVIGAPHDLRSEALIGLQEIVLRSGSFNGGGREGGGLLLETDKTEARLVTQVVKADPPRLHIDVRAQRLGFDQQRPHRPPPTPEIQPIPTTQKAPPQPMLPPMTLSGHVSVAEGRLQHLSFQQMAADLSLLNGLLKTTQQLKLYGGSYQGATQVDLTQPEPSYTMDARVAGLDVGRALGELTPVKNGLQGVLDTDMRLTGRGLVWDVIQKTLSGDGHVKIAEAQLTHFDLFPKLMHLLQNMRGLVGFTLPSGWEHSSWRTIEGDWRLQQGKILTDHLRLRREGVEALLSGHIGLDQAIDYTGTLFLPAKVTVRRGVPLILRQDDAGRVLVPFTVQGTVSAPRISVDEKALVGQAQEELGDTVRKHLGSKIDELLGQPSAPDQPSQESEKSAPETGEQPRRPRWPGKILQQLFPR
jgi:AsmA-like C-terminal region/AsmA family/Domain of Unknown Function (DUF748)